MSEFTSCKDCDNDAQACDSCIYQNTRKDMFIPKPKQKIIKLNKLFRSNIDMEFSGTGNEWITGKLTTHLTKSGHYVNWQGTYWDKCRIRQDHPHANVWNECPLPEGLVIRVCYKNDVVSGEITNYLDINWPAVSRFYVYGPAPTHRYEWQEEKEE